MKLASQDEKELMQVYNTWWKSYLHGDIKTYDSYLAKDFRFIGSTSNEDYLNKSETTKFFKETADQLAGKAELRNLERTIDVLQENLVLITDLADAYVLSEPDWIFYSRFRFTSIMKKSIDGWRFTYQHFSAPDTKARAGETLGTEKISKENQELRYAIKRRTIELEHSNRELAIEAALERVRTRTMAMQKSDELKDVIQVVYEQFINLKIKIEHTGFIIDYKNNDDMHIWLADKNTIPSEIKIPYFDSPHWNSFIDAKKKGSTFFTNQLDFKEKNKFYKELFRLIPSVPKEIIDYYLKCPGLAISTVLLKDIGLYIENFDGIPYTNEENKILMRFGHVFQQTYTRFLDLQKAELQTRESQINLAVERVRAEALAMHKSEEIMKVVAKLKDEVLDLEIPNVVAATIFLKEGDDKVRMWDLSTLEKENDVYQTPFDITFKLKKNDPNLYIKRVWETKDDYFLELQEAKDFKRIIAWLKENGKNNAAREVEEFFESTQLKQLHHAVKKLNNGKLVIDLLTSPPDEMEIILTKMGAAFDLAYKRFEDLQKAEAQTRESLIETGLERVRSRTLAMQSSDELAETAVVLFKQLIQLGIAPNRLFIGIINNDGSSLDAWATNEDGSKIANHYNLIGSKNKSIKKMLEGWKQKKKTIVIDMTGKELQDYFQYLNKEMNIPFQFGLEQKRRVQTIAYFSGGLIGMAAAEEQPKETIQLLERFADVFNLTYTRFNDLKVAEAQSKKAEEDLINLQLAKKSAEEALVELQHTQKQLIHSEKMASLGELTAGIAHEIQNPLNFVNNFSEVSNELIDEMGEEIEKGDLEEAKFIMADIKSNLEKINHHGKRADAIVKGMLQHSRTSSAEKEPTDINKLADEYLRLAYHGLRAKDKSFNATLETDFDESIGQIQVIPQDIGRVILNLITNAFYVVDEKKKSGIDTYEPTVKISTKKSKDNITIAVNDNGNGIPKHIQDKIFQPFFTTKPTGQGTGLGLSMSYDIVTKGHGGELKAETKEAEGTTFYINLPITN